MRAFPWFEEIHDAPSRVLGEDVRHEKSINLWRLVLVLLVSVNPLLAIAVEGPRPENVAGMTVVLVALAFSLALAAVLARSFRPWFKYAAVSVDVTLVSSLLLSFMLTGRGLVATNNLATYPIYFLVLAMIARRYDLRLALYGAGLLLAEYAALVLAGWFYFGLPGLPPDPDYGTFSWPTQAARALLLVIGSLLMLSTVASARRLREIGLRDPLTGVFNRRYFEEVLALEFAFSREVDKPLTVAMVDLDGFKRFNDSHGHVKGDHLLVVVADFLQRNLRRSDLLARYGGDEFIVLLLETPPEGAGTLLARLQDQARIWLGEVLKEPVPSISLSFGLSALSEGDAIPQDLILRADQHLYRAKKAGGGLVCDESGKILFLRPKGTTERIVVPRKQT